MKPLHHLNAAELSGLLADRKLSSVELCTHLLARCDQYPGLGVFLHLDRAQILRDAAAADQARATGATGPLLGIPVAMKDIFTTKDQPTTAGSKILQGFRPPFDATAVQKLRDAGAIIFGKTNMDEFAMGSTNENSGYFPCANPWSPDHVPGGSSGGSACAVAAGLAPLALGTDTGGSIRQPGSLCGVVGFKPAYGTVSRYGLIAFASSLDQAGPMTRTVGDALALYNAMVGRDPKDSTTLDTAPLAPPAPRKGLRLGVPKEWLGEGLEPAVRDIIQRSLDLLVRQTGAQLVEISLPSVKYCVSVYYIIATAEASSNLARFDLLRYGKRPAEVGSYNLKDWYEEMRGQLFGDEVRRRIMIGTHVLSSGYYDAYYLKAQKVRRLIADELHHAMAQHNLDLVVGPVSPNAGIRFGECLADPLKMYLNDILTISVNLAGAAGMSVPAGLTPEGLPVGLQFVAPRGKEDALFSAALQFEEARGPLPEPPEAAIAACNAKERGLAR
jgi:aspartyl-tRNA(Asn)/glutamyl-tRNA(Gln) amidotransferase subunit A